jgi:hypothetical protein
LSVQATDCGKCGPVNLNGFYTADDGLLSFGDALTIPNYAVFLKDPGDQVRPDICELRLLSCLHEELILI